jgi:hypothetical protein
LKSSRNGKKQLKEKMTLFLFSDMCRGSLGRAKEKCEKAVKAYNEAHRQQQLTIMVGHTE